LGVWKVTNPSSDIRTMLVMHSEMKLSEDISRLDLVSGPCLWLSTAAASHNNLSWICDSTIKIDRRLWGNWWVLDVGCGMCGL